MEKENNFKIKRIEMLYKQKLALGNTGMEAVQETDERYFESQNQIKQLQLKVKSLTNLLKEYQEKTYRDVGLQTKL